MAARLPSHRTGQTLVPFVMAEPGGKVRQGLLRRNLACNPEFLRQRLGIAVVIRICASPDT
jgi:hypothetical protein